MDCSKCSHGIDATTEYFELHHHQSGSDAVLQHTFCSSDCLLEHVSK